MRHILLPALLLLALAACRPAGELPPGEPGIYLSLLGDTLRIPEPAPALLEKYREARRRYEADPGNPDNLIWYGRRAAYLGYYTQAIALYTEGISRFPNDPRFYRHRGHRYITVRQFGKAIADLEKAGRMIAGTPDQTEPDGIPNARGIPVSTLHGNIWYHLGLAHYLQHNYRQAFDAYLQARGTASNPDNLAATTHWLYMIARRMGRKNVAAEMLQPIAPGWDIIENTDYYKLCLFYKGLLPADSLRPAVSGSPGSAARQYGLANWYLAEGDTARALAGFDRILQGKGWAAFGYIAAESDRARYFRSR